MCADLGFWEGEDIAGGGFEGAEGAGFAGDGLDQPGVAGVDHCEGEAVLEGGLEAGRLGVEPGGELLEFGG